MQKIEVTLFSGRTLKQGIGLEEGKTSENYVKSVQYVAINPLDAVILTTEEPVTIKTESGSVVVSWVPDEKLEQGMAFIPYGLWANQVYTSETEGTGMPIMKGINATIYPAPGKKPLSMIEMVEAMKGEI